LIKNKTILCFASGYDAPPTSKHHVMHLLAEHNQVLWVNYHASRTPTASSSDILYMAKKLGQVAAGLKTPRPNLHVLTPLVVPLPSSDSARKLNRMLLIKQIRRALRKLGNGDVQFWTFTPDVGYLLGSFGEEKVIYYCVDDHSQFTGYDVEQVLAEEEELCRRSDLVITTSMSLQEAKAEFNANTVMVPHGVDYDHFARAITDDLAEPDDLVGIPHPRLGFFGLLRDWVDLDLVTEVARRRPDWHFVMVGDATFDLSPYRLPNVHFLGRKPYEDLPAYCRGFDVGLIPFKINELTLAVNPIKLREYLAAGLPVVSTPLPEVVLYEQWVRIAGDASEHVAALTQAIEDGKNAENVSQRSQAMSRETWRSKMDFLEKRLAADFSESETENAYS
jgi:glycosyltransferase involved in cell wall biosynthesis